MKAVRPASLGRDIPATLAALAQSRVSLTRRVLGIEEGWRTATLHTGWVANPDPPGFFRDSSGFVHLRGVLATTGVGFDGQIIDALPIFYRPSGTLHPHVAGWTRYTDDQSIDPELQIVLTLTPAGLLTVPTADDRGPLDYPLLSLDGVTFDGRAR